MPASLAIDIDPILTFSYRANFPKATLLESDISSLSGSDIERLAGGKVDGVFGGPPCQGFSDIGHRNIADPRRLLVRDFFRIVAELQPAFFVMENVRGLAYPDAKPLLDQGLGLLPSRYHVVGPLVLDAAEFGAATKRRRLFVVGYDPDRCDPLLEADLVQAKRSPATVKAAISDLAQAAFVREEGGFDHWKIQRLGRASNYATDLRSANREFTGHRQTVHDPKVVRRFAKVSPGEVDRIGRHPKLAWEGQCPTLRAGTGSDRGSFQSVRPIHPDEPRVITVREAARLQGFPDSFRFHPTIWHSFRMIGNSVSPVISKVIFSLLAKRMFPQEVLEAAE